MLQLVEAARQLKHVGHRRCCIGPTLGIPHLYPFATKALR